MPFSTLPEKDFFGRQEDLSLLSGRLLAAAAGPVRSAVLSGPRGIGKTELLKQLFGNLFWKQDRIVPFFFTVNPALLSAAAFSRTYLVQFLCHAFAFRRKEQALLHRDGMSIDDVTMLAEDEGALWALEVLDRYRRSPQDPLDALQIAVNAPYRAALATGRPVAVLIDEFQRLRDLRIDGIPDPALVSLFEEPMSSGRVPHLITGSAPEIQEMAVASGLERVPVRPLADDGARAQVQALLGGPDAACPLPTLLLRRLGGNPRSLGCIAESVRRNGARGEEDFWDAYAHEVMEGVLASLGSAVLRRFLPDLDLRKAALGMLRMLHQASAPLSPQRIARSLSLTDAQVAAVLQALYRAGLVRGEFGVFLPVEDQVVRDVLESLYRKELLAESHRDRERSLREAVQPQRERSVRFDLTIPTIREAELVVAQCLEQVGKQLQLHEDTIGQMQIAVIEACINAIEHGAGTDDTITVTMVADRDRLEVSIESSGPEFIVQETGEPAGRGRESAEASGRGWGIKLMKRFADEVRFERTARGTRTVLIKKWGSTAGAHKEDTANRG